MRKLIVLIALLFVTGQAKEINVPVSGAFSDGGVLAVPDTIRVSFYGGTTMDTLIKSIEYSDSLESDSGLQTNVYCTTSASGVTLKWDVYFPSGTQQRFKEYYQPPAPGLSATSLYRFYVATIDTSVTPNTTTMAANAKVSFYYGLTTQIHQSKMTNSLGYADFNVTLGDLYTVSTQRAGATFSNENLIIPDTVHSTGTTSGYNFRDTIYGYGIYSSAKCYVSLNLTDYGFNNVEGVKIVASCPKKYNTCTGTWFAMSEEVMGYTNSAGYLEFELPRSSCIGDAKFTISAQYGNTDRKIGKFTIPDAETYTLEP